VLALASIDVGLSIHLGEKAQAAFDLNRYQSPSSAALFVYLIDKFDFAVDAKVVLLTWPKEMMKSFMHDGIHDAHAHSAEF